MTESRNLTGEGNGKTKANESHLYFGCHIGRAEVGRSRTRGKNRLPENPRFLRKKVKSRPPADGVSN